MNKEYQKSSTIGSLISYFSHYTSFFTRPTKTKFIWLCIGIIAMNGIQSIRFIYDWFLKKVSPKSLNAFYYLLSYTDLDLKYLMQTTVRLALSCIPPSLKSLPVFIIVDDTLQAKFGAHFECRKKLFDHTARNGSNFLNGHSFVGLIIEIPIYVKSDIIYFKISIGYKLKTNYPDISKLQIASKMIDWVMVLLKECNMVILGCDSFYPKGSVLETVENYDNLELVACVRSDSRIYDLPPAPNGKRGRNPKKGKRLYIHNQDDFQFEKIDDYFIATRKLIAHILKYDVIYATVTTPDLDKPGSYRLYLSTVLPEEIEEMIPIFENKIEEDIPEEKLLSLLPYLLYKFRWPIEVVFYEQKTFWSFGGYMLRKIKGIENYVNIINICYTAMILLPLRNENFSKLKDESPQHVKNVLSQQIQQEMFFASFVSDPENTKKYWDQVKVVISKFLIKLRC